MELTPRNRVKRALLGHPVDKVPMTIYECHLPRCTVERQLRNMGLCIVDRTIPVLRSHRPDVKWSHTQYCEGPRFFSRTDLETPLGTVTEIKERTSTSTWPVKHFFSGPDDYKKLLFLVDNESYEPVYDSFTKAERGCGEDIILRAGIGLEPLQAIISSFMGTETFCFEWMDRQDEVMRLYDALVRAARRRYHLLAESPAWIFNYGGNVVPEVIGSKVFRELYLPHYREAVDILGAQGKLVGCHLDANCGPIASLINESGLDYIEAFTPAPETDMNLDQAFKAWPDKCIWMNFPTSHFLKSAVEISAHTGEFLKSAEGHPRFIISLTEDVPPDQWQMGLKAIAQTIAEWHLH